MRPLKVKVRLITNETGEVKEQEVFMGDFNDKKTGELLYTTELNVCVIVTQACSFTGTILQ